ncbi:UNVERIFIED_CONTAM: Heat shock protein 14 [Sesamum angustifolium]|uniref:Heat shock protein 14 n=1 Tax=Sesamum angustifolium TaxID=2727405 RepID=A0AAW2RK80_9LAMI
MVVLWVFTEAAVEEEEIEVPVVNESTKESTKMETDEVPADSAPASTTESDVNMQDAKPDGAAAENGVPESGDKPVQMETDGKLEAPKKKVKKTNVPVSEIVYGGLAAADVQKAVEKEFEMALQDRIMEETKTKRMLLRLMFMT